MRPVRLKFSGLRSYRSDVEVDFSTLDLFAIIGDTGAGKSTIIEALCLALYAKKSWKGGASITDLIADGEDLMRIELVFWAGGREWKVTRVRRRSGSSPVDKLESPGLPSVDQAQPVTDKIAELIGLNLTQFTRAVVLPQGRFDELLQASPTDRNKILASILGHGELDLVQSRVRGILTRVSQAQQVLLERSAHLPDDPAAERTQAKQALDNAEARVKLLSAREGQIREPAELTADLVRLLPPLETAANRVLALQGDPAGELSRLGQRYASITEELAEQIKAADDASGAVAAAQERTIELLDGFDSRDDVVVAFSSVERSVKELPGDERSLREAVSEIERLERTAPRENVDEELQSTAAKADDALQEANLLHEQAEKALRDGQQALRDLKAARTLAQRCTTNAEDALRDRDAAKTAAATDAGAVSDQLELVTQARASLLELERANLIAAAAEGCEPGGICPICDQTIPDEFHVDGTQDLANARQRVELAEQRLRELTETSDLSRSKLIAAEERARNASKEADQASASVDDALRAADEAGVVCSADNDDHALGALVESEQRTMRALADADAAQRLAHTNLNSAQQRIESDLDRHQQELKRARSGETLARAKVQGHAEELELLPRSWWPHSSADGADLDELRALLGRLRDCRDELQGVVVQSSNAQAAHAAAIAEQLRLESAIESDILRKAEVATRQIDDHLGAITYAAELSAQIAEVMGRDTIDAADFGHLEVSRESLPHIADLARSLLAAGEGAVLDVQKIASDAQAASEIAQAAIDEALQGTGCTNSMELHAAVSVAEVERSGLVTALERVERDAAAAERTAELLNVVTPLRENLDVLVAGLSNKQFVDHVLKRREAELLGEASRRLRAISQETFAFTDDFKILNLASGRERGADELSGGERFQASLALALALVEIASRGAGKLDAVFIDEGFGALDSNALENALDTLGSVAGGGKMVALISHLRTVADYVDTVLHVTRDDVLGSSITLLTEAAREELLSSDAQSRLTG